MLTRGWFWIIVINVVAFDSHQTKRQEVKPKSIILNHFPSSSFIHNERVRISRETKIVRAERYDEVFVLFYYNPSEA